MKYNLRAASAEITKAFKKASIGKGKDSGFALAISKKTVEDRFNQCSLTSCNGNMQATAAFCVQMVRTELMEGGDGKEVVVKEPLKETVVIFASALLRDAVETLGNMEEKIFLIYDEDTNKLEVKNKKSFLPIPIVPPFTMLEIPKNLKSVNAVVEKEELISALKYVNVALGRSSKSKFESSYGIKPMVDESKAVLHIFACDEKSASYQHVGLVAMSDKFKELCEDVMYAMLPSDKVSQIIAESEQDKVRFTIYYEGKSAKQVNIKTGSDMYQILTKTNCVYPQSSKKYVDQAYDMYEASFQTDVSSLKSAFQVTALGAAPNQVKSVMQISSGSLTISDESGERVTKLNGIDIKLGQPDKTITINVATDLIMSALGPFTNEKIRIQGSNEDTNGLISLVGGKKGVHIAVFPVKGKVKVEEIVEEDDIGDPDENEDTVSDGTGAAVDGEDGSGQDANLGEED